MKSQVKKKRRRKNQGIITVFVTLIMVPVVVITAVFVDVSRLKLYSSQAVMAADSYGEAVLSEYDNLLKELYGLFSVTQNTDGLAAIEKLADYTKYSFDPNGDNKGLSGFMPYKDADMEVSYEKVEGASLTNNNVLETQISDFMKYRIVEELMDKTGILGNLSQFNSLDSEMNAMESRSEITQSSAEALGKIDQYYQDLKKLAYYPSYLDGRQKAFEDYSKKLTEIAASEEYEKYVNYLLNKSSIDAARNKIDSIDPEDQEAIAAITDKEWELYDQYVDVNAYKNKLSLQLNPLAKKAADHTGTYISFDTANGVISDLGATETELRMTLQTLDEQVAKLKGQLDGCSQDVREGIEKEIADLESIIDMSDDFRDTYRLIAVTNDDKGKNNDNKKRLTDELNMLNAAKDSLVGGNVRPGDSYWAKSMLFEWYDFRDNKNDFYLQLQQLCDSGDGTGGDKDAGDKQINKANEAKSAAEDELKKDEDTDARDISSDLASQLKSSGASTSEVPDLGSYFSGGLSFQALSSAGSNVLDKFLVTTYDFGMFSSRVSGIKPGDEDDTGAVSPDDNADEEYADYSLTNIKMSKDVNYLYGAELEYLLGGRNESKSNLNEARNIICGVRLTMNFVATYSIQELNSIIEAIAEAAAAAVAASVVGAAAAPLVKVAVSGALRMAVATMETAADWKSLMDRESVLLLKTKIGDLQCIDKIESLLGKNLSGGAASSGIKLSYEDYLYVLMCLLIDDNTLLSRTSNLITLNVNQAKNSGDTLSSLDFKMSDTVTAVKATAKLRMDFVVLPDNFAKMFLSDTDTESTIQVLEDTYFGYSIIRGY